MSTILEAIKRAILASDKSRYRIARESGVSQAALSRLMSGERGLSIEAAERLAEALDLQIEVKAGRRKKGE